MVLSLWKDVFWFSITSSSRKNHQDSYQFVKNYNLIDKTAFVFAQLYFCIAFFFFRCLIFTELYYQNSCKHKKLQKYINPHVFHHLKYLPYNTVHAKVCTHEEYCFIQGTPLPFRTNVLSKNRWMSFTLSFLASCSPFI